VIGRFETEPLKNPRFIRPMLVRYEEMGRPKTWEVVEAHDSVAILIFDREKEAFILVRQFRPAVYLNGGVGMTVELCAGIVDKALPLERIAQEEILEETGYAVLPESIERITSFYTSVGFAGSRQTLYYVEVTPAMRKDAGGGVDEESIEVVELPVREARRWMYDESIPKTPGLLFAFCWFFNGREREYRSV
jgi:UDP-sugar diphosphatase